MPEGHTVHRLARTLRQLFDGEALRVSSPQGRFTDGAALLDGRRLVAVEAWGKQLFCGFTADDPAAGVAPEADILWLRTHLGLYGAWTFATAPGAPEVAHAIGAPRLRVGEHDSRADHTLLVDHTIAVDGHAPIDRNGVVEAVRRDGGGGWDVPRPRGQVRVRVLGGAGVADLTGAAACEVISGAEKDAVTARLGPDPIRDGEPGHSAEPFVATVGRSRVTIGQLLLDQAVIAGVGNIYRAEALFRGGVDPLTPGRDVPPSSVGRMWDDLVVLMRDGARTGAIVTTRPRHRDTPGTVTPAEDGGDGGPRPPSNRRRTRQNTDGNPDAVPADQAFYVYHRDGLPCRVCGDAVLVDRLAGRNLFWCGTCQS